MILSLCHDHWQYTGYTDIIMTTQYQMTATWNTMKYHWRDEILKYQYIVEQHTKYWVILKFQRYEKNSTIQLLFLVCDIWNLMCTSSLLPLCLYNPQTSFWVGFAIFVEHLNRYLEFYSTDLKLFSLKDIHIQ